MFISTFSWLWWVPCICCFFFGGGGIWRGGESWFFPCLVRYIFLSNYTCSSTSLYVTTGGKWIFPPNGLEFTKKGDDFCCLVGGFNPLEKYWPNWIFSPGKGENKTRLKPVVKKKSFFRTPRNFRGKYSFMRVLICFSKQWGSQRFFRFVNNCTQRKNMFLIYEYKLNHKSFFSRGFQL